MLSKHCESICFLILFCVVIGSKSSSIASNKDDEIFLQRLKDKLIAVTNLQLSSQSSPQKVQQQSVPIDIDNNLNKDQGPSQYQNPVDAIRETIINTIIREVSNNLPEILRQTTEFFSQMRAAIVQAFTEYAEQNPNYLNESSVNRTLGAQFIKIVDSIVDDKGNRFNESQSLNYVP